MSVFIATVLSFNARIWCWAIHVLKFRHALKIVLVPEHWLRISEDAIFDGILGRQFVHCPLSAKIATPHKEISRSVNCLYTPRSDDDKIHDVPEVPEVAALVQHEPHGQDLGQHLRREDHHEHRLQLVLQSVEMVFIKLKSTKLARNQLGSLNSISHSDRTILVDYKNSIGVRGRAIGGVILSPYTIVPPVQAHNSDIVYLPCCAVQRTLPSLPCPR